MATDFPSADASKKSWFQTHDWQLGAIILAVVALFLALLIPLISTLRLMGGYHDFIRDLSASAAYGREHSTTTVTLDGELQKPNFDGIGEAIGCISDAGMGRTSDAEPEGGVLISFGDGTTLSLSPVAITTDERQNDTGVLVRYTREDGSAFAYDSDRLGYEALCDLMRLPS